MMEQPAANMSTMCYLKNEQVKQQAGFKVRRVLPSTLIWRHPCRHSDKRNNASQWWSKLSFSWSHDESSLCGIHFTPVLFSSGLLDITQPGVLSLSNHNVYWNQTILGCQQQSEVVKSANNHNTHMQREKHIIIIQFAQQMMQSQRLALQMCGRILFYFYVNCFRAIWLWTDKTANEIWSKAMPSCNQQA